MRRIPNLDAAIAEGIATPAVRRLSEGGKGFRGVIVGLSARDSAGGLPAAELERRLLEMGFVEGARITLLHEGFIGRDPIAVRLDDMRVALRRCDAAGVMVRPDHGQ